MLQEGAVGNVLPGRSTFLTPYVCVLALLSKSVVGHDPPNTYVDVPHTICILTLVSSLNPS